MGRGEVFISITWTAKFTDEFAGLRKLENVLGAVTIGDINISVWCNGCFRWLIGHVALVDPRLLWLRYFKQHLSVQGGFYNAASVIADKKHLVFALIENC